MYVVEIVPTADARGRLGVLFLLGVGLGIFACYMIGNYISYWQLAFLFLGYAVIQGLLPFFIKESPSRTRNVMDNCKALCSKGSHDYKVLAKNKYINKKFLLLSFITISLFSLQQLTGFNAISSYVGPIFLSAGGENWSISPGLVATISIGLTQIVSPIVSFFIINKMSRTLFLFFGALGMMFGNIGIASYFAAVNGVLPVADAAVNGTNENGSLCFVGIPSPTSSTLGQQYSPLAMLSIALFVVSFAIGWGPPLFVYAAELFPNDTRGVGLGLGVAFNRLSVAVITFLFPLSAQYIGPSITYFTLACIDLIAAMFVVFIAPETQKKEMGFHATCKFSFKRNVKEFRQNLQRCLLCRTCRHRSRKIYSASN